MSRILSLLSKNIASSWFSLVVTTVCQLIMVPIALGVLGKADFALYAVISQILLLIRLAELGIASACSRLLIEAHAQGKDAYHRMWTATTVMFAAQALFILLLTLAISPFLGTMLKLNEDVARNATQIFLTVGSINAINYAFGCITASLYAGQKLTGINFITALSQIVQLAAFAFSLHQGAGLWSYPIALVCSLLVYQGICMRLATRQGLLILPRFKLLDRKSVKSSFRLGLDVFGAALFSMAMGNSLLIFSGHLMTMEQTAVLAVHLKLVSLMINLLQRIPGSAEPIYMKMVSENRNALFRIWWQSITKLTLALTMAAGGCFIILCRHVITIWVGSGLLLPGLAVAFLALVPARFLIHYTLVAELAVFKEVGRVKWLMLWEVALYTILAYGLGNSYGITGLIASNLLSMLGGSLLGGIYWFAHFSGITRATLLALCLRSIAPLILCFWLLQKLLPLMTEPFWGISIAHSIVWLICCALLAYLFIMTRGDREVLLRRLKIFTARPSSIT